MSSKQIETTLNSVNDSLVPVSLHGAEVSPRLMADGSLKVVVPTQSWRAFLDSKGVTEEVRQQVIDAVDAGVSEQMQVADGLIETGLAAREKLIAAAREVVREKGDGATASERNLADAAESNVVVNIVAGTGDLALSSSLVGRSCRTGFNPATGKTESTVKHGNFSVELSLSVPKTLTKSTDDGDSLIEQMRQHCRAVLGD